MAVDDAELCCSGALDDGPSPEQVARRKRRLGGLAVLAIAALVLVAALLRGGPAPEHAFLRTLADGTPVSYPCAPISVVVDPAGAPSDWSAMVDDALATLREASGYDVRLSPAQDPDEVTGSVITVRWSDAAADGELSGPVLGVGGSGRATSDTTRYADGFVLLDTQGSGSFTTEDRTATLLHEFGHVLGLDHVGSPAEIMSTGVRRSTDTYGPGDREGLQQLFRTSCGAEP